MAATIPLEDWIAVQALKHGGKYDYSLIQQKPRKQKQVFICHEHGRFEQSMVCHAMGSGCRECGKEKTAARASSSPKDFETKAMVVHGGKYTYTGDYLRFVLPVTVVCNVHGSFRQKASTHLRGHGCPKCAQVARGIEKKAKWSSPDFHRKMTETFRGEARSSRSLKLWKDESFRESVLSATKAAKGTPEYAQRIASLLSSPEYRLKLLAGFTPEVRARIGQASKRMWESDEHRVKMAVVRSMAPNVSALSHAVAEVLDRSGVDFVLEHPVGPWVFDVWVPSHNLLLELNGEYWHSLPRAVRNDKSKATYIERYFPDIRLMTVWEVEFYKEGRLKAILEAALGLPPPKTVEVPKDRLEIRTITHREAGDMYSAYHYLGSARGRDHHGLFYDGTLIGACSFGPFQRNQQTQKYGKQAVELTRFCLDPAYQAKLLSSWFLSRCLKRVDRTVVTYADSARGHSGILYAACNFKFDHVVEPVYHYVDDRKWVMHKRTVWGRAKSLKMSETDYAEKHGLTKKWGGEKRCFIYEKRP